MYVCVYIYDIGELYQLKSQDGSGNLYSAFSDPCELSIICACLALIFFPVGGFSKIFCNEKRLDLIVLVNFCSGHFIRG